MKLFVFLFSYSIFNFQFSLFGLFPWFAGEHHTGTAVSARDLAGEDASAHAGDAWHDRRTRLRASLLHIRDTAVRQLPGVRKNVLCGVLVPVPPPSPQDALGMLPS